MPDFAPCESHVPNLARRKSYSAHTNWFARGGKSPKRPHKRWIFAMAWLWQLGPHREDIDIHAYHQHRTYPTRHSAR